ncbi:hypothetical protein P2318_20750 [Myxococcaceae bacterium GXIMD 01537]
MIRSPLRAALPLIASLLPALALASSVYLNGVKIDGVTNQKFEKATVRIDEQGNVLIEAPGYAARVVSAPPAAPAAQPPAAPAAAPVAAPAPPAPAPATATAQPPAPPPAKPAEEPVPERITRRYWLVTEQSVPGMTEYEIDVYVNSKWLRKLRNNEEQVISEITRSLQPGKNVVLFSARKLSQGSQRSQSRSHFFKVTIGEGNVGGDNVMIDNPLVRFQRTAADTQDVSEEFTLSTH